MTGERMTEERQTGRTTRQLSECVEAAKQGFCVAFIVLSESARSYVRTLLVAKLLGEGTRGGPWVTRYGIGSLTILTPEGYRAWRRSPVRMRQRAVTIIDHAAVSPRTVRLVEECV